MTGLQKPSTPSRRSRSRFQGVPSATGLLRWVYLGRVIVAIVVFAAAALSFRTVPPETILVLAIAALASVIVSGVSLWQTHVKNRIPGLTFLHGQFLFDLLLVTTIVHVTEGPVSQFPALYVPIIAVAAALLPLASSLLLTSLASLLYLADIVWWYPVQLSVVVWLQIAVFLGVFLVTALIASRVRVVGAEHAVLQQEVQRLRLEAGDILRNIRSGILTVDGDGRIAYANPAARELLGLRDERVIGRGCAEVLDPRVPELSHAILTTQRTGHRRFRAEGVVRCDGRETPIGFTTMSLDVNGGAASVTAIFTDISHQKRLEELHLRTERLEAVAELSASLAHEIRNPLASIRSSVEQLSRSARANADERSLAELVVRESDRLSRLLNEFLDFSRVQVTDSRPLDLAQVAKRALDVVRNHPECGSDVTLEIVGAGARIEGDEDLLHRVIVNLVLNAVQAGTDAVTVEIRIARADELPLGVTLDDAVLVRVSDRGPGIPPELRDRLFDPFVTGRQGGSGLGLAIVHRAIQAHRGYVLVDSAPGVGTTFTVFLPSKGMTEIAA